MAQCPWKDGRQKACGQVVMWPGVQRVSQKTELKMLGQTWIKGAQEKEGNQVSGLERAKAHT